MELHVDTISDIHSNPMGEEINLRDIKNDIIRTPSPLSCKKVQVPNDYTFGWCDEIFAVISMIIFVADIVTDCYLASSHYKTDDVANRKPPPVSTKLDTTNESTKDLWERVWNMRLQLSDSYVFHFSGIFELTTYYIILPSLVLAGISARIYLREAKRPSSCCYTRPSKPLWTLRIICLFLFISPIERSFEQIIWGRRFRRAQKNEDSKEMHLSYAHLNSDLVGLRYLRLFEGFLECAPQLMLQLQKYMGPMRNGDFFSKRAFSIEISLITSTLSLALSLTSYREPLKCELYCGFIKLPSTRFITLFFANFFGICARFIILCGGLANGSYVMIWAFVWIHWTCAALWLWGETIYLRCFRPYCQRRQMNNDNNEPELIKAPYTLTVMEEVFQGGVLAVVYLFAFVNTRRSRRSRYRYITYYTLLFLENTGVVCYSLFYYHADYYIIISVIHVVSFLLHICLLVVYYIKKCEPSISNLYFLGTL